MTASPEPQWAELLVPCPCCGAAGQVQTSGPDAFGVVDSTDCPLCETACEVEANEAERWLADHQS